MSSLKNQLRRLDERKRTAELEHRWAWRDDAFYTGVTYGHPSMHPRRVARLERRMNRYGAYKLRGSGWTRPRRRRSRVRWHGQEPERTSADLEQRRTLRDRARNLFKRAMRRAA